MAVVITLIVKGGAALRELMGYERQSNRNSAADKRAGISAEAAAKKQSAAADRASKDAQRAAERAARAKTREEKQAADEAVRVAEREAREKQRLADRTARYLNSVRRNSVDMAMRESARLNRLEEQSAASRRKAAERTLRTAGGVAGGIVAGAAVGLAGAAATARDVTGVDPVQQRIKSGVEFKRRLIISTNQAGIGDQAEEIQRRMLQTGRQMGMDPLAMMGGLQRSHEEFNALKLFSDKMGILSKTAQATGSDFDDLVGMMGNARRAFNLKDEDFDLALNTIMAGAATGSVGGANFARDFPAAMGIFATNTGLKGMEGVKQFSALAQTVATGGFGSAESATRVERFSTDLSDVKVRTGLQNIGIKLPKEGAPLDVGKLVEDLAKNKQFGKASIRQDIFKEVRALQAVESLVAAKKTKDAGLAGAIDFTSQKNVDAVLGSDDINKTFAMLESGGLIDIQRQAVDMQADTIEKLKGYNEQVGFLTTATNALEKSFGTLGLWLSQIGSGGLVAGGTMLAAKFFGSGAAEAATTAAGATAGGASMMATLGTGVTAVGAGALAIGTLVASATGTGAGMLIDRIPKALGSEDKFSDKLGKWWAETAPWEKVNVAKGFEAGAPQEPIKVDVDVKVGDDRTSVKAKTRDRGARVTTAAGPTLPSGT